MYANKINITHRIYSKLIVSFLKIANKLFISKGKVLVFHSVGSEDNFNVTKQNFHALLQVIKGKVVPLDILLSNSDSKTEKFSITFDDVRESFYFNAYPILCKYKIPFTLFVATSLLGEKGYITEEQLKEVSMNNLCTIGSHTVRHSFARYQSKEEFLRELKNSKRSLEKITQSPIKFFAFPYGTPAVCSCLNIRTLRNSNLYDYGFSAIFTHLSDFLLISRFFLPRITVTNEFIKKNKLWKKR